MAKNLSALKQAYIEKLGTEPEAYKSGFQTGIEGIGKGFQKGDLASGLTGLFGVMNSEQGKNIAAGIAGEKDPYLAEAYLGQAGGANADEDARRQAFAQANQARESNMLKLAGDEETQAIERAKIAADIKKTQAELNEKSLSRELEGTKAEADIASKLQEGGKGKQRFTPEAALIRGKELMGGSPVPIEYHKKYGFFGPQAVRKESLSALKAAIAKKTKPA